MTDIPSALKTIDEKETRSRASVSEATLTKIGGSINALVKTGPEAIGTIETSILTVVQFQSIRGTSWVRMEGQSIAGSDLASLTGMTTLPDMVSSGRFLRQSASNEADLATTQEDENKSHRHLESTTTRNFISGSHYDRLGGNVAGEFRNMPDSTDGTSTTTIYSGNTVYDGGAETRPKNIRVNYFIKINNY